GHRCVAHRGSWRRHGLVNRVDVRSERGVRPDQRRVPNLMTASTVFNARKDFLSVLDFDPADLDRCLNLSAQLKSDRLLGRRAPTANSLEGRHVAMLFEKASLRTRSTFEIATREL